jgi:predicted TIM-barrel fold metal-dependent hydrolase
MDRSGVARAILSIPHPVAIWDVKAAEHKRLARDWNDYMAGLGREHEGRFGCFALLPLPDMDASLREVEYALDTLHADGIGLTTNIGDKWLGDPFYAPLFAELERRRAAVYVHPILPDCCHAVITPELNFAGIDFPADTTRAIHRMLFSGSAARYPNIRWIFSHGGGTVPFLLERLERVPVASPAKYAALVPNGVLHELKKFNYELAQASHAGALVSILRMVDVSQLMFGTDFPIRSSEDHIRQLGAFFSGADLDAVLYGNAERVLARR